ncbi:hypothetical protein [Burkholderia gladioli]|uniref:hypothetical protein n=1 Tax=Burkholderia gladioli TaxID=28095 RepID=UPI0016412948|nr:hypothetical protein [Burkholderia gladioli]
MDHVAEIVSCDADIDKALRASGREAQAILEAYRIAVNSDAFVAALAAKLVLDRRRLSHDFI